MSGDKMMEVLAVCHCENRKSPLGKSCPGYCLIENLHLPDSSSTRKLHPVSQQCEGVGTVLPALLIPVFKTVTRQLPEWTVAGRLYPRFSMYSVSLTALLLSAVASFCVASSETPKINLPPCTNTLCITPCGTVIYT